MGIDLIGWFPSYQVRRQSYRQEHSLGLGFSSEADTIFEHFHDGSVGSCNKDISNVNIMFSIHYSRGVGGFFVCSFFEMSKKSLELSI